MSEDSIEWFDVDGRIARTAAGWLGLPHVPIKSLSKRHEAHILAHMLSLGENDRRLRFGNRLGDAGIRRYVESIAYDTDGLFGVFDQHLQLRAFCHMALLEYEGVQAGELGLSVDPEYRGHGIGSLLFARACNHARIQGIERVFIHCLLENNSMLNIAIKAGMEVDSGGGECEAHLCLPPAWTGTRLQEALHEQVAVFDVIFKRQINRVKDWAEWAGDATSAVINTVADIPGAMVNTATETITETIPDAITSTAEVGAKMVNPMNFIASSPSKTDSDIDKLLLEMPPPVGPARPDDSP
jgi:GNAT superfamily N-acetyltransferase